MIFAIVQSGNPNPVSRKQDGLRKLNMTFSAINVKRPHENAGSMAKFLVMV